MAKIVTKHAAILFGSKNIGGLSNTIDQPLSAESVECSTYDSDGWKEYDQGLLDIETMLEGYMDGYAGAEPLAEHLFGLLTADAAYPLTVIPHVRYANVAAGDVALLLNGFMTQYANIRTLGQFYGYRLNLKSAYPLGRGQVLEKVTRTATGNSAALDYNAAVASGERLIGCVHVIDVSGTNPTLDLVLESDADSGFASATTRSTVPQFTAAGYHFFTVAGPITDEFYRVAATVGGTDTPTFEYVVAIARVPFG